MTKPGSDMHGRVADKVAIVTGAGRGIGRAALDRLAAEGANVVGIDINQDDLDRAQADLDAAGLAAAMYCGDATEESHAARLVEFANERFGPVDILVNNIGTTRAGRIWEMAVDDWDYIIRTNLRSAFLCTRAVAPQMIARRSGRIVNLSSGARHGAPWQAHYTGHTAYATTKAGIQGFTRNVALELSEFDITVNAVAPGPIKTESTVAAHARWHDPDFVHSPLKLVPLGRAGTVEEIASAILFLASDEASYITGAMLDVTGGR
ncbi:SDR family NAD(P)-dependent oxidoreductase [Sphingobium fuliginis]|jgi:3-oxoacyl-[acyl-carrier protein] reductase|uniref:SDR family oxidoreductase n=2 Tax=Sphingobium fuliginis (strain ATCC 27551) TaxID=336203 RepID=A0A7M2GPS1_SPHSA|nr:SDR family NAD(P)-dependent oxidoreductase [Sphingobium fuliginis]QDC39623.1 SDR family oxidoreductase [Sphingobium fuliginis ATCC 27551]QOT73929.1 SDR family oxidoreductase [Sphingobium fuliginis]